jgi:hypothetical protein
MSFKDLDLCPVCDGDHGPAERCLPEQWTRNTWDSIPPSAIYPSPDDPGIYHVRVSNGIRTLLGPDIPIIADTVNPQSTAKCGNF